MREELITLYESERSDFYRRHWGALPVSLEDLPTLSSTLLAETPYTHREYDDEQGIVKTFTTESGLTYFVRRSFSSIKNDASLIAPGPRAFVLAADPVEGMDFALACYEEGSLPYQGDVGNLTVGTFCAEHFRTTTLIADTAGLRALVAESGFPSSVEKTVVIDHALPEQNLLTHASEHGEVVLLFSLPEAGIIGTVATDDRRLNPAPGVTVEAIDGVCAITKLTLTTPLVRYITNIPCTLEDGTIRLI